MNKISATYDLSKANFLAFRIVKWSALLYFVVAIVSLLLAFIAVPPTGLSYPFLDTLQQYPRDYLWQYSSIVMLVLSLVLNASLVSTIALERRVIAHIGLVFSVLSCGLLIATYYVQVVVVPISLMSRETEGLALLTQYNPHGVFIALEEIGYLLMTGSLVAYALVFRGASKNERALRLVSLISVAGVVLSLVVLSFLYGLDKKDRLEVAVILIVWVANILVSFLVYRIYRTLVKDLA